MLKTIAVVAALTTASLAQTTLIPEGISQGCTTFLTNLNNDSQLASCINAVTTGLSAFAPGSNGTVTASTITTALGNICSSTVSSSCPADLLSTKLTQFYAACGPELTTAKDQKVIGIYDVIYAISPLQKAVCSKDDSGKWCVMAASPAEGTSVDSLQSSLFTESGQTVIPNTSAFQEHYIPFLFISPSLSEDKLCTTCTRNVLASWIQAESVVPYAPGLPNSQLLSKQNELFAAVQSKCGSGFLDSEVKAAGGIGKSIDGTSAAVPNTQFQALMAAVAGFMTLAAAAL